MVEVPDYSFISKDSGPSLSGSIGNWLNIDKSVYDLKEKGAQEAIGNILQQSTDAQGNVDYGTANALAAKAGPRVQMGMQTMLQANSARRGEQITQGGAINTNIARAGASLMQDSSDANVDATIDNLIATNPGQRQLYEAERQRLKAMNPQQRVQYSYQHVLGQLDGADQLLRGGYGAPVMTTFGGTSAPVVSTPGSPYRPAGTAIGGGVAHTVDPGTYYGPQSSIIMYDANGQETTDPTKAVRQVPRDIPRGPAMGAPPPGTVGGPPGGGSSAAPPSPGLPPGAPPPLPGQRLVGGRFVTPSAAPAPNAANPPPSPSPAAPPQPPAAARPPPTAGVVTGLPTGTEEATKTDISAYKVDQAAQPDVQTRAQNMAHAYDALQQLKSATGRGAEGINNLRSWAQTLGILPAGAVDEQRLFEIVHKYTERAMIDAAGGGSTDMGKRMQEQANAGTLLSTPANLEILRNDMGTTLQRMAAYKDHKDPSGVGYLQNRAKLADSTDPRGFVWNLYSPEEQAKINAEVDKDPVAEAKLHKAIGMAGRLKLQIPGLTPPSAPQRQSFLTPPQPEQNPLQMTG